MRTKTMTTMLAAGVAAVLALSGCSGAEDSADFNDADAQYAAGMIVHHEQAIEMSDIVLAKPDLDPAVAELAEEIKAAQGPEIEQMNAWLDDWGQSEDEHGGHEDMSHDGMMSEDDLAELEAADGADASRMFLEQMIVHHEGAVAMAEQHLEEGQNSDALALSENVIADQNAEIEQMREMLTTL